MDISGKVLHLLPLQSGQGKNGTWKKLDFVIETSGQYPKKVCFSLWGDKIDSAQLKVDEDVTVSFEPESREYNGKWYTDLRAWKISKGGNNTNASVNTNENFSVNTSSESSESIADDLPF